MTTSAETESINKQALERATGNDVHPVEVIDESVRRIFTYQEWTPEQIQAGQVVRDALASAYKALINNVPSGPTRTRAMNALIDSRLLANAAITFPGE